MVKREKLYTPKQYGAPLVSNTAANRVGGKALPGPWFAVCEISTGPTPLASQFPIGPMNRALPLARLALGIFVEIVLCQLFGPVKPGLGQ